MPKISLSRKGFDSSAGGSPSPIINNLFISLPIPEADSGLFYKDLHIANVDKNLLQIMRDLGIKQYSECHMDPNLNPALYGLNIKKDWPPAFGQDDSSQSHLSRYEFGSGDLFLFFGKFRFTEQKGNNIFWSKTESFHAFYGFMEIGNIVRINSHLNAALFSKFKNHPHVKKPNFYKPNSTLYLPALKSRYGFKKTFGTFQFNDALRITEPGDHTNWLLPEPFRGKAFSYINQIPSDGNIIIRGRGQEFIGDSDTALISWLRKIIQDFS